MSRIFACALMILFLVAATARCQEPPRDVVTNSLIAGAGASHFADAISTAWFRGAGVAEGNPALQWATESPVRWTIVKGGISTALTYAMIRARKKHPVLVRWLAVGTIAGNVALITINTRALREHERKMR